MYPLVKSALLLTSAMTFFYGMKPPTPRVDHGKQAVYKGQVFEHTVRGITYLWQAVFCAAALGHIGVMLVLDHAQSDAALHESLLRHICRNPSPSLPILSTLTWVFLCSVALLIAGGALRLWCYETLGRYFTYEITILDDHDLVTTGPYAAVRHPSYTGACMMIVATTIIFFGSDGYIVGCNMRDTPVLWFIRLWMVLAPYAAFALVRRANVEDAQLKKSFGAKWETYREKVPYKFVPYVL